jgi:hypothetical protein
MTPTRRPPGTAPVPKPTGDAGADVPAGPATAQVNDEDAESICDFGHLIAIWMAQARAWPVA